MKKQLFNIMLLGSLLSSCGDSVVKPSSPKITGPLSNYFEVIDREYKINDNGTIQVEIKRIAEGFPAPWVEGMPVGYDCDQIEIGFNISLKDKAGDVVSKDETSIVWENEDLKTVASLSLGESSTIPFSVSDEDSPVSFVIGSSSEVKVCEKEEALSVKVNNSSKKTIKSGDVNWDEILDEYEGFVDEYVKLLKKSQNGDLSAMSSYMSSLEKAQKLSEKLSNAKNDISHEQLARYNKVLKKMTSAAASIYQ